MTINDQQCMGENWYIWTTITSLLCWTTQANSPTLVHVHSHIVKNNVSGCSYFQDGKLTYTSKYSSSLKLTIAQNTNTHNSCKNKCMNLKLLQSNVHYIHALFIIQDVCTNTCSKFSNIYGYIYLSMDTQIYISIAV